MVDVETILVPRLVALHGRRCVSVALGLDHTLVLADTVRWISCVRRRRCVMETVPPTQGEILTFGHNNHHQLGHAGVGLGEHVPEPRIVRQFKGDKCVRWKEAALKWPCCLLAIEFYCDKTIAGRG